MTRRYSVRLTRGARADLGDIASYLAREACPAIAAGFLDDMRELVQGLQAFPEGGAVPKELEGLGIQKFRQAGKRPYRLIYRVNDDIVFVLLIADGRRDMNSPLQRRLLG